MHFIHEILFLLISYRVLRPGTPYAFIVIKDALIIGANFYCRSTMACSLQSVTWQHCLGNLAYYPGDDRVPLILYKMFDYLVQSSSRMGTDQCEWERPMYHWLFSESST